MLKYANYDIVFQEFPDEVTLAVNLTGCPVCCPGCHSIYLQEDKGDELTPEVIFNLIDRYSGITCIGLMGGDAYPDEVAQLAVAVKQYYRGNIKTGWYSGRQNPPKYFNKNAFNYVKFGPYREELGPLNKTTTNQRLFKIEDDGTMNDITYRFWKK